MIDPLLAGGIAVAALLLGAGGAYLVVRSRTRNSSPFDAPRFQEELRQAESRGKDLIETAGIVTTASSEHPALHRHLSEGGLAAWTDEAHVLVGTSDSINVKIGINQIPLTMNGTALFQMRNVMAAAATAAAIGFSPDAIASGLARVTPDNANLPTSLNSFTASGVRILVDRPSPSWFLGPLLRATRALKPDRIIFVLDYRDVANQDDSVEVGRMIGRHATVCVVTNEQTALASVVALKAGIARNEITPPIVHTESLAKAVLRGLSSADEGDLVVVLTSRPQTVYRTLARHRVVQG